MFSILFCASDILEGVKGCWTINQKLQQLGFSRKLQKNRVRPKSAIGARSARSAVCSKLPSNRKIACRYVTALIGPDQKVPLVVNPNLLQMALFGLE